MCKQEANAQALQYGLVTAEDLEAQKKIVAALETISDQGIDTGFSCDGMDFWVKIDGREYFINAKQSQKQISTQGKN